MPDHQPQAISEAERRARIRRATQIARRLGFVGRIEYRHVFSSAGGAQYGVGATATEDLLPLIYADAFQRDADPEDFSLEAIIAHECGHQLLCRQARLARYVAGRMSLLAEEILASLLGSLIAEAPEDREALVLKALAEMIKRGMQPNDATRLVAQLRSYLEEVL